MAVQTLALQVVNKTWNGTEWNGMENVNKHEMELMSWHEVHLCTHGPLSYTHTNCSYTQKSSLTHFKWMGSRLLQSGYIVDKLVCTRTKRDATAQYNHSDYDDNVLHEEDGEIVNIIL